MTFTMFMVILFCLAVSALGFWYASFAIARPNNNTELEELIDQVLPQTQCGLCNFSGCLPYARAITSGQADINQCPPGGSSTIRQIAELTGREFKPLRPDLALADTDLVALIDEDTCIGCVKCIRACPVDAIIGAAKQMHTVIPDSCTGCRLCISPCPVDCITMIPINRDHHSWKWIKPGKAVPL